MRKLSVDPGLHLSGLAIWKNDLLQWAGIVKASKDDLTGPAAWNEMANQIRLATSRNFIETVYIEIPQVYRITKSKGDPNDLIQIAGVAGAISARFMDAICEGALPREWKGQVPKDVIERRCREKLSQAELENIALPRAKGQHEHVWDAIGLGLYFLKKERQKVTYL